MQTSKHRVTELITNAMALRETIAFVLVPIPQNSALSPFNAPT
ncbi:MAG: hypothetical protein AAGF95_28760 [Chloroflexota bacterium]